MGAYHLQPTTNNRQPPSLPPTNNHPTSNQTLQPTTNSLQPTTSQPQPQPTTNQPPTNPSNLQPTAYNLQPTNPSPNLQPTNLQPTPPTYNQQPTTSNRLYVGQPVGNQATGWNSRLAPKSGVECNFHFPLCRARRKV